MITRRVRLQLFAFGFVTIAAVWYGAVTLLDVGKIVNPPYTVMAEFDEVGGVYPRADVDLLGTRVGKVTEIRPGPGQGSTVVMAIDHDVELPADVRAIIGSKSAIGEGFVELEPPRDGEGAEDGDGSEQAMLADGDTIPLAQTQSPADLGQLLGNLDSLARSVPVDDLATVLDEGSQAVDGLGPTLGRLIDDSATVIDAGLRDIEATTSLIRDARSVLSTQAALDGPTQDSLRELADLLATLDDLSPRFVSLYGNGLTAATETTRLMVDLDPLLPGLLRELNQGTDLAADRTAELRKILTVFPWALEVLATGARYCDVYDIETGQPVESTCHYDDNGEPIYTLHLAQQISSPGYEPCTRGYEGTPRYTPNGEPVGRSGPVQGDDSEPNLEAGCSAPPDDGSTPNVRGSQNVTTPAHARRRDGTPRTGGTSTAAAEREVVVMPVAAPGSGAGDNPLAWLLTRPVTSSGVSR